MVHSSAAFEEYFQHTISHTLQLSVSPTFLLAKLAQVEDSKYALEATVLSLQLRLLDLEERLNKFKDEASMNACALRKQVEENQKQVMENQRLQGQLNEVSQRCIWLEEECSLYHNDRELFQGVAEEAEDRACRAEERCDEAESKMEKILAELNELKHIKNEHAQQKEELDRVGSKVLHLEATNADLQAELSKIERNLAQSSDFQRASEISTFSGSGKGCEKDGVFASSLNDKKTEQSAKKERLGTHQLMAEVQRLWKEVALYKCNLARAEIQVRILDDDNKDLRSALRNRMSTTASPIPKKGKTGPSFFDNMGVKKDARQPLSALESNMLNLR
ncbi:hypothetical protein GOP47_0016442 [Adiantum capillus-veneris]|uniref:Uncharacterized protein n=1 Tax=Adiantum capillus-veneris TaxID=13818 RepID=A0A9D4UI54_ADICA|nr:hypothetical protein GOP47_0016442 [Adiantum capillus-veneris]